MRGRSRIGRLKLLLRGDADRVAESVSRAGFESVAQFSLIILIGAGVYGATLGLWRAPLQALYTSDQISARDFSHMPWQRRDQWNVCANSRIAIVVQANGGRDSDELRNCRDNSGGFRAADAFRVV